MVLHDFKGPNRNNAVMTAMVASLTNQDMADIAAWYSRQPLPAGTKMGPASEAAELLVERGDGKRILPPCQSCHRSEEHV